MQALFSTIFISMYNIGENRPKSENRYISVSRHGIHWEFPIVAMTIENHWDKIHVAMNVVVYQ